MAGAGRLGVPALLLVAVAVVACGPDEAARPVAMTSAAVLPSYEAPAGVPGFCTRLASLVELGELPVSIGTLTARADVGARVQVSQVIRELRGVLAAVRADGDHDGLATALDALVRALGAVVDGPLTDPVRGAVTAGLQQVSAQAQPDCGFPS